MQSSHMLGRAMERNKAGQEDVEHGRDNEISVKLGKESCVILFLFQTPFCR